jgi:hypothetical protein
MQNQRFMTITPATPSTKKVNYGRPLMRKLVAQAKNLGISVDFHIDADGRYVVKTSRDIYVPPTAAAACHLVMGMIDFSISLNTALFPTKQ